MQHPDETENTTGSSEESPQFYCPNCKAPVSDPLVCGDCRSVICRRCGTPLESADELGMG